MVKKFNLVLILSLVSVLFVAGCLGDSGYESDAGSNDVEVEETEPAQDADYASRGLLRYAMGQNGFSDIEIDVQPIGAGGVDAVLVEYTSSADTRDDINKQIGFVSLTLLGLLGEGWEIEELSATANYDNGNSKAEWYVSKEWIDLYKSGEISAEVLAFNALGTYQELDS